MPKSIKAKKIMAQMISRISNSLSGARVLIVSAAGNLKRNLACDELLSKDVQDPIWPHNSSQRCSYVFYTFLIHRFWYLPYFALQWLGLSNTPFSDLKKINEIYEILGSQVNPDWHEGWYFYLLVIFWSDFVSWFFIKLSKLFKGENLHQSGYFDTLPSLLSLLKVAPKWR